MVRVGVDHSYGKWNAPCNPDTREFVYVPIPEKQGTEFHPGCERRYSEILPVLQRFTAQMDFTLQKGRECPPALLESSMHLDPDFDHLTYGDVGDRRGSQIRDLKSDDLLVFYAGLRPCVPCDHKLIYALIGMFVVEEVVNAASVPEHRWAENAHTRKTKRGASDIIVRGKPRVSGRFSRFIPIGEYRDRAYRVRRDLLNEWEGLSVSDGYIQRSARPPRFLNAPRFHQWLDQQKIDFVPANNPSGEQDRVVIVHLRQPRRGDPNETRADPFWEFGSFGCTGCHGKNLMNPRRIHELDGARLAIAQGGAKGFRLVMLTPPVRAVTHKSRCELRWEPAEMPFRYDAAPRLVDANGESDFPSFLRMIRMVDCTTWPARFFSKFRSARTPLRTDVAEELCDVYRRLKTASPPSAFATGYEQAMPYPPNVIDGDRRRTYQRHLRAAGASKSSY